MTHNNDLNNLSELFDNRIKKALKDLGYIFPETAEDFIKIEAEIKTKPLVKPNKFFNPLSLFETNINFCPMRSIDESLEYYENSFSQAAREGGDIDEAVSKRMREDRMKAQNRCSSSAGDIKVENVN